MAVEVLNLTWSLLRQTFHAWLRILRCWFESRHPYKRIQGYPLIIKKLIYLWRALKHKVIVWVPSRFPRIEYVNTECGLSEMTRQFTLAHSGLLRNQVISAAETIIYTGVHCEYIACIKIICPQVPLLRLSSSYVSWIHAQLPYLSRLRIKKWVYTYIKPRSCPATWFKTDLKIFRAYRE
jgi:hypothetical protein